MTKLGLSLCHVCTLTESHPTCSRLYSQDLINKKTKFFGGDSITMVDYMMWPFFERLEVYDLKQYVKNLSRH